MVEEIIRASYRTYETKDRPTLEKLLRDDFVFTSPYDDHIDRKTYFERCWPFSEHVRALRILKLFIDGNDAFVLYECEPIGAAKFKNTEFVRTDGERIVEVEVYFGSLPSSG